MHFRNCGMLKSALRRESQPRTKFNGQSIWPDSYFFGVRGCVVAVGLALLTQGAHAEDTCPRAEDSSPESNELICPPVCSPLKPIPPELRDPKQIICEVTTDPGTGRHTIKVNLKAQTSCIKVGGYTVKTENYNGTYLTPVIEALPGDTVAADLVNSLDKPLAIDDTQDVNPTNLHYFHGGIVSPNNARPKDARDGTGDNIYVWRKNGTDSKPFPFSVPIPGVDVLGVGELDARVLEGKKGTFIPHPPGLDWWHSHLHGKSSNQVMGGMSGLLSVGEDKAAVKAECNPDMDEVQCNENTKKLRERTIVRYAMLRDISLINIKASPIEDTKNKTADWAPWLRNFGSEDGSEVVCKVWKKTDPPGDQGDKDPKKDPKRREGFCQRDQNSAWLFTLNGQRFPTITVGNGKNLLLRLGNLSANVAYRLELVKIENESTETKIPLTVLSVDGVVPQRPVDPKGPNIPVGAITTSDLLLMPASRAEIYVNNDSEKGQPVEQVYILRTKGLDAGFDQWPEIQLARIVSQPPKPLGGIALALNVLQPSKPLGGIALALNVLKAQTPFEGKMIMPGGPIPHPPLPPGCVRDLDPSKGEHRRVTFDGATKQAVKLGLGAEFGVRTEIVHPPGSEFYQEKDFKSDDTAMVDASFEEYEQKQKDGSMDGSIDWEGKNGPNHVCIHIDDNDPDHKGSHKQLWVLTNKTAFLHNFHIHQMKFRLATLDELLDHHIMPSRSHTCNPINQCTDPDYKLYDPSPDPKTIWHDTIPVPADERQKVFIIMSFDDPLQVGRFVYHCHILKHEDKGLMAPIEVWRQ
jgi:FtsP/CotA-like multicopper oxidase with cupredoxin domain